MPLARPVRSLAALLSIHLAAALAAADVKLNTLFGDGMVIQRDAPAPIWGTATPAATLEARVGGKSVATAKADAAGKFRLELPAMAAPGPYEIEVRGDGKPATLRDVLAGDVWLCSGQSNMQWTLFDSKDSAKAIAEATLPTVRLYQVPRVSRAEPADETGAQWRPCTPQTVPNFSGVAFFFGRKLNRDLNVPIGLIHSSFGGTPAESWTPRATLHKLTDLPALQKILARAEAESQPAALEAYVSEMREWMAAAGHTDAGIDEKARPWAEPDFDDAAWSTLKVPANARQSVGLGSVFWLRKTFDVPAELAGKPFTLDLSIIDDFDRTFVNGQPVGATGIDTPTARLRPRSYAVPAGVARAGRNVVAIRVHDIGELASGLVGNANQIRAFFDAPAGQLPTTIELAGDWRYAVERPGPATTGPASRLARPTPPLRPESNQFPSGLYNAMIAPLGDVGLRGVIWYQGESNTTRPKEYAPLLTAMIGAWREQFKKPELPFYLVGLANFGNATDDPNKNTNWGPLRQAQREVARTVPHVATTVTIDVGDPKDIHPRDKLTVGERLALVALADTYGQQLVSRGPTLKGATREGGRVTLTFDHVGGGLTVRGEKLGSFSVAGADGNFAWADATIDGDRVIVSSPNVAEPTVVRYAYADDPTPTLFNREGLPAEPFEEKVK